MKKFLLLFSVFIFFNCSSEDSITTEPTTPINQEIYFPPISGAWETLTPSSLNWDETKLNELYAYIEDKNTKGFIILKDGKIVVEKYFNGHSQNATNPWFSAVKSLTATAIGIAQDEGILNIESKVSDYLGNNWSSLTQEKQDLIKVKNLLSMTSGLVNNQGNFIEWTCTIPSCMKYATDAGTAWEYHQGAFTQLQRILTQNTSGNFKDYIKTKVLDKIGASGSWESPLTLNIFSSNTRSMARFGLLSLNKGKWNNEVIVNENYFNEMTNTSQSLNKAYGYLWWLNGKESFVGTDSNLYQGKLIPVAPNDMIAALGAQDQKIYVIPSQQLVVVRCGEETGVSGLANSSFDNELWIRLNEVIN